ncbi:hypothetical protein AMJ40_06655, partial [candidate division TA06 bacterium DG_26]
MIVTVRRDLAQILKSMGDCKRVYIVGCAGCATLCETGGEKQTEELAALLSEHGKEIVGRSVLDVPCDERIVRRELKRKPEMSEAEAILVMACGAGIQAVRNLERIGVFKEYCSVCANCVIDNVDNLCPITRCAKGLLNGPCGGVVDGKCEVDPEMDCVWELIYTTLQKKGELWRLHAY